MAVRFSHQFDGLTRLEQRLLQLPSAVREPVAQAVEQGARRVQREAMESIQSGPKTGRVYTHYLREINGRLVPVRKRNKPHQASRKGEAPASDEGILENSIFVEEEPGTAGLVVKVGTDLKYGRYLEFGTDPTDVRKGIEPRPWLLPALRKHAPSIIKLIRSRVARALRATGRG